MTDYNKLRSSAIEQLESVASKQRFGYFTIPANLAIGDNQFEQKKAKKDQNGRVVTQPRNLYPGALTSGNSKSSYFSLEKSIYDGDVYMDPGKYERQQALKIKQKLKDKQIYRPVDSVHKSLMTASYEYVPCKSLQKNPRDRRNQQGKVITQPKNITTNPTSKVIKDLFKPVKYESSPYDAAHKQKLKALEQQKKKLQQVPFKSVCKTIDTFGTIKEVFGETNKLAEKKQNQFKPNIFQHQAKFRPSNPTKEGYQGCFQKFPKYMQNPPTEIKRKPALADDKKQNFKLANPQRQTSPSPSVSLNKVNLRRLMR